MIIGGRIMETQLAEIASKELEELPKELHRELDEILQSVEKQMQIYDKCLKQMMQESVTKPVTKATDKNADYFITKYKEKFAHNSLENIHRRRDNIFAIKVG